MPPLEHGTCHQEPGLNLDAGRPSASGLSDSGHGFREGGRPLTPVSAARLLGVSRRTLYNELAELGVD